MAGDDNNDDIVVPHWSALSKPLLLLPLLLASTSPLVLWTLPAASDATHTTSDPRRRGDACRHGKKSFRLASPDNTICFARETDEEESEAFFVWVRRLAVGTDTRLAVFLIWYR